MTSQLFACTFLVSSTLMGVTVCECALVRVCTCVTLNEWRVATESATNDSNEIDCYDGGGRTVAFRLLFMKIQKIKKNRKMKYRIGIGARRVCCEWRKLEPGWKGNLSYQSIRANVIFTTFENSPKINWIPWILLWNWFLIKVQTFLFP